MKMEKIRQICNNLICNTCPFYDYHEFECLVKKIPMEWDIDEIKRRLEKYGTGSDKSDL